MGELISCGKQCATECCLGTCPTSAACQSCNNEKCVPSFEACSGVIPPDARETALSASDIADIAPANLSLAAVSTGDACVDQPGWDANFDANMYTCGLQSAGLMPLAGSCMASKRCIRQAIDNLLNFRDAFAMVYSYTDGLDYEIGRQLAENLDCGLQSENDETDLLIASITEELGIDDLISDDLARLYDDIADSMSPCCMACDVGSADGSVV